MRNHPAIEGLDDYRVFTDYFLHYVGISKKNDSLTRLVIKPHDKRLRILSNENTKRFGSRLTDEMILLFFRVEPLRFNILMEGDDLDLSGNIDISPIVSDAEKAFVKISNAEYNIIKYKNYPRGKDGLYNTGLNRYGFVIGEDITLTTDSVSIVGTNISETHWGKNGDLIYVNGDNVSLEKFK